MIIADMGISITYIYLYTVSYCTFYAYDLFALPDCKLPAAGNQIFNMAADTGFWLAKMIY